MAVVTNTPDPELEWSRKECLILYRSGKAEELTKIWKWNQYARWCGQFSHMAQKAGLWQKLMRKELNQISRCTVGCSESAGLITEQAKVSSQSLTPPDSFKDLLYVTNCHTIRDGGCELVKCVIQGKVSGKRRRGRPKTSYSSNITKWTSESTERITRETRDHAGWRRLVRCASWWRLGILNGFWLFSQKILIWCPTELRLLLLLFYILK